MDINLTVNPKLVERIATSLERLCSILEIVHAPEIAASKAPPVDGEIKYFYQSDRELYEQEQKAKVEEVDVG